MFPEGRQHGTPVNRASDRADGCNLLWREGEGLWTSHQARDGTWPVPLVPSSLGYDLRGHPPGSHGEPKRRLCGSSLPCPVRASGEWRSLPPRLEGEIGQGCDQGPRAVQEPRGGSGRKGFRYGRDEGAAREASCLESSPSPGRQSRGGVRGDIGEKQEKEEREGKRKEEEAVQERQREGGEDKRKGKEKKRKTGWAASHSSSGKGSGGSLWGNSLGPRGEDKVESDPPSQTLHEERQEGEKLIKSVFKNKGLQQQQQSPGYCPAGGGLHRDVQSKEHSRALSWGTLSRSHSKYEGQATQRDWGRDGVPGDSSYGSPVLQAAPGQEGVSPGCSGVGQLEYGHRPPPTWQASTCAGHNVPEDEVSRSNFVRNGMAGVPAYGDTANGEHHHRPADRVEGGPKGDLRGVKGNLVGEPSPGRERSERKRPEERCEGKGRWQERRKRTRSRTGSAGQEGKLKEEGAGRNSQVGTGVLLPQAAGDYDADLVVDDSGLKPAGGDVFVQDQPPMDVLLPRPLDDIPSEVFSKSGIPPPSGKKSDAEGTGLDGSEFTLKRLGGQVLQRFLEVLPLRSQPTGAGIFGDLFPVPTSKDVLLDLFPDLDPDDCCWFVCVCLGLNSVWGGTLFNDSPPNQVQTLCLRELLSDVKRLQSMTGTLKDFDWVSFFRTRSVDYRGDEVKIALKFSWSNIAPALPREIGVVPLEDICSEGAKYYVENFDLFLKKREEWPPLTCPQVMVRDEDWAEVCSGLVGAGVCTFLEREEVFDTGDGLLLNGLFGVTKGEMSNGVEVYRLIMNLVPLNGICHPLSGDVATLPSWSSMSPYFLQPSEGLLVSSEDVRCFFYVMSVPLCWHKYLAFNKVVPDSCLPEHLRGREVYLSAKVLPMGFLNSVSLAQHVHRTLVQRTSRSYGSDVRVNDPSQELRKDKQMPLSSDMWRVYLDNYDLLEKVEATEMVDKVGSVGAPVLALREQYEVWGVPRNVKKAVQRQPVAEVQGATVDGVRGVAFPRETKLLKYVAAALKLCAQSYVSQRQMQVVCGGLVYVSMFRRPLLGTLNAVWKQIESFGEQGTLHGVLWAECRYEILRFVTLIPLARMDFRLTVHPQITCSDASTTGGGLCASSGLTGFGHSVSQGGLRGQIPHQLTEHAVLSIGLFDGIGALRVALELLDVEVLGHISVEQSEAATRVVEASFPSVHTVKDVCEVTEDVVRGWSVTFSQCSLVLLGGGPPCQGVSGLNADRKGALKDERPALFVHVKRIEGLVKRHFPWCQVHSFMESVASMDEVDKQAMSDDFNDDPWKCDAGTMTWCNRPRLYWMTWELTEGVGVQLLLPPGGQREVCLTALQDVELISKAGWIKADPSKSFPTFTTSRPRQHPGRKPAGMTQCSDEEIQRWTEDSFRFPPYQYMSRHCLVNREGQLRLPDAEEREFMMGFPVGYTLNCLPKSQRKGQNAQDLRLTLLGNSWSVPVVAWFLSQLLAPRGLCATVTVQDIVDKLHPNPRSPIQSLLFRQPLRPARGSCAEGDPGQLAFRLANLVSIKGEDILLTSSSKEQVKFHRLRASVPSKLWKWRTISGWKWTKSGDHINVLELRAILTSLTWRIIHRHHIRKRMIHLTDSLVCLHCLTRGRSSSRKLLRTLSRINALLLVSSSQALWAYVHTDQNPADRPSRWSRKVKT